MATGHQPKGNPKIHKLDLMEKQCYGRLLWVTDANVRVETDTLRRLVDDYLEKGGKLIFSPIMGTSSRSLASLVENTSLNFFTSGNVITLWKLFSRPVVIGKSMLIDRATLRAFGSFQYFKDYLAEDYLIGKKFQEKGFKVSTNFTWVININQQASFQSFYKRMARWAQLRYQLHRPAYVAEILLNPIILALFGLIIIGIELWRLSLLVVALKILLEYFNFLAINTQDRRKFFNHLLFPLAVIIKDFIFFGVYLLPYFRASVEWRGERLKIGRNTLICYSD